MKKIKTIYTITLMSMLFILSCDKDTPVEAPDIEDSLFYCLSMVHSIEGGNIDYADNNSNDQRVITVSLNTSTNADCSEPLNPVSDASIIFDWDIVSEGSVSGASEPHLQTIPIDDQTAENIYQNEPAITNSNGEISFYWIDEGQEGCVYFYCDYTDNSSDTWSLETPEENCDGTSSDSNPFEVVAIEITYENIAYFDLDISPDTLIFNDLPLSVDSTNTDNQLTIMATVKDENGVGLEYIPVQFSNSTLDFGVLSHGIIYTDAIGSAQNTLVNIDTEEVESSSTEIIINANITGGDYSETITETAFLVPQSQNNIWQVSELDAAFFQSETLINNVNITYNDTIEVQVLDVDNTPISGVPIHFSLNNEPEADADDIGYLDSELEYSDDTGFARNVYHISAADLLEMYEDENSNCTDQDGDGTFDSCEIDIYINIFVSDDFNKLLDRTYTIQGNPNIEYDVAQFQYWPLSPENGITVYAYPNTDTESYIGIDKLVPIEVKNADGVLMEGVPIQFELYDQSRDSNGSLSTALVYTCCSGESDSENSDETENESSGSDTGGGDNSNGNLIDWNGDGTATTDENKGIGYVIYSNDVIGTSDGFRAYISDPNEQDIILQNEEFIITTAFIDESANYLDIYANPASINIEVLDSTYCDTIYAIAKNEFGTPLQNIPINFSIDENDFSYGLISNNYAITDTVSSLAYFAARTTFCTYPNIEFSGETISVDISATVPNNSELNTSVAIPLTENLPDCPNCEESLVLEAVYHELPVTIEGTDVFTSLITATVVDSTENPVPEGTLVTFRSLGEDENGDLNIDIGSIDPYVFTGVDENGNPDGKATAIYNMGNDVGLASIIAEAPEYGLADTTFINNSATTAAYLEIIEPYPNEIMIQGGGGLESTDIEVIVKDGNGNPVSEPYLVYFQLKENAPNGSYLNDQTQNNGGQFWCVESDALGFASVTLNSGNAPGSVPILAELHTLTYDDDCDVNSTDIERLCSQIVPEATWDDDCNIDSPEIDVAIASLDDVPVTILTGPPHSGEINFSYVDITPIGGGLYQVPLSVQLEDEWANPVSDSTNVYIWIESYARAFDYNEFSTGLYSENDTLKWGIETSADVIDIRDSLSYVLLMDLDLTELPEGSPNNHNEAATGNSLGTPDYSPGACNCYADELFDECEDGVEPGTTLCTWEVIPTQPGQVVGEAKTGMLGPNNEAFPGIAWSNVHYGTSDMFERTVIKAMTYDEFGNILLIDSRNNHSGQPLVLPYQPGGNGVSISPDIVFWDFGTMGMATAIVEPDWVNDPSLTDATSNGITVTVTLTDYYEYPVDKGIVLLTAPGSTTDDSYDAGEDQVGSTYDWVACNPVDTDGDGITGICFGLPEYDNDCSECVSNFGTWFPDQTSGIEGSYDDNQALCITNSSGQCTWVIHYWENLTYEQPGGGAGDPTFADFTSTLGATLQNPLITTSAGVDIRLEKNPPPGD